MDEKNLQEPGTPNENMPAVLGIIGTGIIKLGTAAIKTPMLGILLVVAFVGMRFARMNLLLVLLLAGVLNLLFVIRPQSLRPTSASAMVITGGFSALGSLDGKFLPLAWLLLKTRVFSFGGAYASLAFLQEGAVENHHWLTSSQFLDGVALSVATPGPFMLFATFVGYLGRNTLRNPVRRNQSAVLTCRAGAL